MSKLFIVIKGQIVCLHKENGRRLWSTKLKRYAITNVVFENNVIYAYTGGHLFCLNADTGNILWENELTGLGYGPCIIATENQNASHIAHQLAAQQIAAIT